MTSAFANLATQYDKGLLVPFIGAGMSLPACLSWTALIEALEVETGINASASGDLVRRSQTALDILRSRGENVGAIIASIIYADQTPQIPRKTQLLASLYWPLVCTTNYDDLYLRAVWGENRFLPHVLGRSEVDCHRVLQHLQLPTQEVLWALQGFLGYQDHSDDEAELRNHLPTESDVAWGRSQIVVGHGEYRKAAHRSPHFRRCFAEIYRNRSLLFLGSGLTEPYFLSLFDEIIDLMGPPVQPHFALIKKDSIDTEYLQRHYHIICHTYEVRENQGHDPHVEEFLMQLRTFIQGERARAFR